MGVFVAKLLLFAALQAAIVAWLVAPYRPNPTLFWAATRLKHERLAGAPSPRLVLVGGSNLAFGFDSQTAAAALGMSVVNMGMDAGLGLDFLLNEVTGPLRAGDVVVLSLEYELFIGLRGGQAASLARVLEQRPEGARHLAPISVKTLLDHGFGFVHWIVVNARKGLDGRIITGPYGLSTFDDHGDAVWHLDRPQRPVLLKAMERFHRNAFDGATIGVLNRFHRDCRRRGVRVYLSHPPLPDHYGAPIDPRVAEIARRLAAEVGIPALDRPADMFFPAGDFYDTEYHLRRRARADRTQRIVAALRRAPDRAPTAP